jgi:anti-sigma factor RsiW
MKHEEVKSLLGAYALGAVDEGEARAIREHLATCPECAAEFALLTEAVSALALAAAPQEPSAAFDDGVLEAAGVKTRAASAGNVVGFNRGSRKRTAMRVWLASGIAALLVAVAVLSLATINANHEVSTRDAAIKSLVHGSGSFRLTGTHGTAAEAVTSGGQARFVATGLGSAPQGKTYQLWIRRN